MVSFEIAQYLKPSRFIVLRRVDSVRIGKSGCSVCNRASSVDIVGSHVFHYDRIATQLRRNCDRTVTRNCEKLRRSYA